MKDSTRKCEECAWIGDFALLRCMHPNVETGDPRLARSMLVHFGGCGGEGAYWKPKEKTDETAAPHDYACDAPCSTSDCCMGDTGDSDEVVVEDDYNALTSLLAEAILQASEGKGKERHANGLPFHEQDIVQEAISLGLAYPIGQARKKAKEAISYTLPQRGSEDAVAEILGAINYLAAAAIAIRIKARPNA